MTDAAEPSERREGSFAVLRIRRYAAFVAAAFVSNAGLWASNLAVPYVVFQSTRSALWVSWVAFAQFVPNFLAAPLGGTIADRFDRRLVLLVTQAAGSAAALLLWLAWSLGAREPLLLLALVALAGLFQGLNLPAWQAFVTELVPLPRLKSAVAVNSLQFNAARSLGPVIGGALIATAGPGSAFLFNALSFLAVLGVLLLIRREPPQRPVVTGSTLRQFTGALAYVRRQPGIATAIVAAFCLGALGNPVFQFTVVFAEAVWHIGPTSLGLLNGALGVGVFLVAPALSSGRWPLSRIIRLAMTGQGLALVAFALAPNAWIGAAALVLVGAGFFAGVTGSNTAVQFMVAEHLRGRVIAIRTMVFIGSMPLGAVAQGWLADVWSPRHALALAGVLLFVAGRLLVRGHRSWSLARVDDPPDFSAAPVAA